MKVEFSPRFRHELRREYFYIHERNPQAAEKVWNRIIHATERLESYPMSGRTWRMEKTFELIIPGLPYIVIYDIVGDIVQVLTLFHTDREFPPGGVR